MLMEYIYIAGECACVGVFKPHTERDIKRARFAVKDDRGMPLRMGTPHFEWDNVGDLGQVFGGGN